MMNWTLIRTVIIQDFQYPTLSKSALNIMAKALCCKTRIAWNYFVGKQFNALWAFVLDKLFVFARINVLSEE
jgi:hypothetical protein